MQWPDDDQGFANTASDKTSPDRTLPIPNVMTERESFRHQFFDHPLLRRRAKLERELSNNQTSLWKEVQLDYLNYYDLETLKLVAGGALIGAAIANTTLDQQIQDHFQASVRGATSDDWFEGLHSSKELGNGLYTLPIFGAAWLAGEVFDDSAVMQTTGRWGKRTLRSFLVGAPPLIVAQRLTGGSRPNEDRHASHWQPFNDNNGVSGHAFMSALPFINAAKMTDRRDLKTILYAGSLLGPISRVNDEAHYPSQVALGWWLAYVAATAIERTDAVSNNVYIHPYVTESGATGGMLQWRY
ncbi:phosphatase PAP2 family protein [Stieleria sp. JC731]|uniref:phosphatase PAP2 family protein n=1 Tax=Pirellulaceae TaxID=2691357 RepID=UPI001E52379F|nr:phosphatase PAP2 family protein [Stieleria sp. JC731]MCC9599149.1 phosphatase PAP2 family protein [Stieleria sp. JC731]